MPLLFASLLIVLALLQPRVPMAGGGEIVTVRNGDTLRVVVTGPRSGLAHLCVAEHTRVRILHASAAVGEAVYEREGDGWRLKSGFEFKLRDRRDGGPTDNDKQAFLKATGWLANADNSGEAPREFAVQITSAIRSVAAAFLATEQPMAVSHWPAAVADDCIATKMVQGFLPLQARFNPSTWHRVE